MNKLFTLLTLSLMLFSCQPEGRVFSENKELSAQLQWLKEDVIQFDVPIDDISSSYDMNLNFRYATGYQFDVVKVRVTETSPSGKEVVEEFDLKIRDKNGDYIGEPALDIWDSEHLIKEKVKFNESGTYTYKIEHTMPQDQLHFAMELGLTIDKSK